MEEVLPGVLDWQAVHENLGLPVHSHAVDRTLIDPMLPAGGPEALAGRGAPERIVLTNRHHDRHAARIAEAFGGIPVLCPAAGLHELADRPLSPRPYRDGDEVAPGMRAHRVLDDWPDELALHAPDRALLIVADAVIRDEAGELAFVRDAYLGEDPDAAKAALRAGLARLLALDFDHLLLAHGPPWIGGAKSALREFLGA